MSLLLISRQDFVLRTSPYTLAIFTPRLLDLVKPDHLTPELSNGLQTLSFEMACSIPENVSF